MSKECPRSMSVIILSNNPEYTFSRQLVLTSFWDDHIRKLHINRGLPRVTAAAGDILW